LRGYRGGVTDEDLKLKALREEERKLQQDAQQNLHSYKALQLQEGSKPKEQTRRQPEQHYPTPVNVANGATSRDPMEGIVSGSVSERAAALAAFAEAASEPLASPTRRQHPASPHTPGTAVDATESFAPPIDSTDPFVATEPNEHAALQPENPEHLGLEEPIVAAPRMTEVLPEPLEQQSVAVAAPTDESVDVAFSTMEEPTIVPMAEIGTHPAHPAETNGMVAVAEAPQYLRVDVLFSFGLVTVQSSPELTSYMVAVQKVVTKCLQSSSVSITYDPLHMPFVKDLHWDGTCNRSHCIIFVCAPH
jgi:hypothetical protein